MKKIKYEMVADLIAKGELDSYIDGGNVWVKFQDICKLTGHKSPSSTIEWALKHRPKEFFQKDMSRKTNPWYIRVDYLSNMPFIIASESANSDLVNDSIAAAIGPYYLDEVEPTVEPEKKAEEAIPANAIPFATIPDVDKIEQTLETRLSEIRYYKEKRRQAEEELEKVKEDTKLIDMLGSVKNSCSIGDFAKMLYQADFEIGRNRLFRYLRDLGLLIRAKGSKNMPTQAALERGYFSVHSTIAVNQAGETFLTFATRVTGKGQIYIAKKLIEEKYKLAAKNAFFPKTKKNGQKQK